MPTTAESPSPALSRPAVPTRSHHRVVIIGGGTAGISVAARLRRAGQSDIALIEPSERHYYQPLWTLVGAGLVDKEKSARPEAPLIPDHVEWIRDRVEEIDPEAMAVTTASGDRIGYDFLIVAPGIQIDWDKIPGLSEALQTPWVSSNYDYALAEKTAGMLRDFRGGTALFTNPGTPIKCAGAPQKIMYLAAHQFQKRGILQDSRVVFGHAGAVIFGVEAFARILLEVVDRYGIDVRYKHELVEVRPGQKEAVFRLVGSETGETRTIPYDIMHATPPMSAPDFIKRSPLAVADNPLGWANVDKHTLQSPDYSNVFALGDAGSTPNSKTGAAIRKQAPVVVENLLAVMEGREPTAKYDGYASCPLVTAENRMLLAEFDYTMQPAPSIPVIDTIRERYDMYLLKRYGLPWMYWNLMMKGLA
jgi:sulfide:quinone oxidoreductase